MRYIWYKNGRDIMKSWDKERKRIHLPCVTQEYFDGYIGHMAHHEGDVNLFDSKCLTTLGKLESVGGYLDLRFSKITSLGDLRSVDGGIHLTSSNITSLGKLESVSVMLGLSGTKITSLGNLKAVNGHLHLSYTNITDLGELEYVGGDIHCVKGSDTHKLLMNSKFKDQVIISE